MIFREATIDDIAQIQIVRNSVKENMLSDPALVSDADVAEYITKRGKGWVCVIDDIVVGFSIVSLVDNNIWALFVKLENEKRGIGWKLHDLMLDWYFGQTKDTVWLSTSPGTRSESFYLKEGWRAAGNYGKGELKFEMTYPEWCLRNINRGSFIYI